MGTMTKPLLIIQTGSTYRELRKEQGDFVDWIRARLGEDQENVQVADVTAGEKLPAIRGLKAVIVTGSHAMVTERRAWSERTAEWLVEAVAQGLAVLGICYGHQLLAHALGGKVGKNPNGREFGAVQVELNATAQSDALFSQLPGHFPALVCHTQSVLHLPAGAVPLGQSRRESYQAVRYAEGVWGVQFHPEFSALAMRYYLQRYAYRLSREGQNVQELLEGVRETPESASLIQKFCALV